ncbi:hypothetical protein [Natronolimnobius sp. AArcel1]|uniref:hypothetical protein n=1 Tax=Natronolimnobius sp. AArcel1 TaxID=1679093 RepID=UPI001F15418F|nr:hypothetical protein [Natronolimnobius sp. AArcel1]
MLATDGDSSRIASSTVEYLPIDTRLALVDSGFVLSATSLMDRIEQRVAVPGIGAAAGQQQGTAE